jgi:hypothetical protein
MATISYGNGGWIRVDEPTMPGQPIYVRYHSDNGRPVMTDFYVDGRGHEIPSGLFRQLDPTGFTAWAMRGESEWLERSARLPGPDLSRLASWFNSIFGRQTTHWVADSMRAQITGNPVKQARMGREPELLEEPAAPEPVKPPIGLTDDFLGTVADNYAWALRNRQRPAPMIANQTGSSVRTVHAWIRKARDRGILAPTTRGKVG